MGRTSASRSRSRNLAGTIGGGSRAGTHVYDHEAERLRHRIVDPALAGSTPVVVAMGWNAKWNEQPDFQSGDCGFEPRPPHQIFMNDKLTDAEVEDMRTQLARRMKMSEAAKTAAVIVKYEGLAQRGLLDGDALDLLDEIKEAIEADTE